MDYTEESLNEVLIDLNVRYQVQVSISSKISSTCPITVKQEFQNISKAMEFLATKCDLDVELLGKVYVFSSKQLDPKLPTKPETHWYLYQGKVVESGTLEPLPFTSILLGDIRTISNEKGEFSINLSKRETHGFFSHLGYYKLDTILYTSNTIQIQLKPATIELETIVVNPIKMNQIEHHSLGRVAGQMVFNDVATTKVPGDGNNLIFNYVRLYPGVLASGESSSEYSMWGSYPGQNQVLFDGITIFNSSGLNDNIGRVNPTMVKQINVFKAGYNVEFGDRVGGIMLIEGKEGNRDSIEAQLNLSTQVANAYLNIPLFHKSSNLQISGRISYLNLLNNAVTKNQFDESIMSNYDYHDLNLKYTTSFKNGDLLNFSSIYSKDNYAEFYNASKLSEKNYKADISSIQFGNSLAYHHQWRKGGISKVQVSQSFYDNSISNLLFLNDSLGNNDFQNSNFWTNNVLSIASKVDHIFPLKRNQSIRLSLGHQRNQTQFNPEIEVFSKNESNSFLDYVYLSVQDKFQIGKRFTSTVGVKSDYLIQSNQLYIQPRFDGQFRLTERVNLNSAWGIYKQYVGQIMTIDEFGNSNNFWEVLDDKSYPSLSSMHSVLGISYLSEQFDLGIEGFYISNKNLSRRYEKDSSFFDDVGNSRSFGGDVFMKIRIKKHQLWTSYTLSKVDEQFEVVTQGEYLPALHDQRHELKVAASFNFRPFFFSITNVWGSGFNYSFDNFEKVISYNRLDASFQYHFNIKNVKFESGISILNVLNAKNFRLYQYANFPDGSINSVLGVPFTSNFFLNIRF